MSTAIQELQTEVSKRCSMQLLKEDRPLVMNVMHELLKNAAAVVRPDMHTKYKIDSTPGLIDRVVLYDGVDFLVRAHLMLNTGQQVPARAPPAPVHASVTCMKFLSWFSGHRWCTITAKISSHLLSLGPT